MTDHEYVCDRCDSVFDTLEEIKEHARDAHDADASDAHDTDASDAHDADASDAHDADP